MKKYSIVLLMAMLIVGCCKITTYEYKYELTYTDGTTEMITTSRKLKAIGGDCVSECECSDTQRWCGVRKAALKSKRELDGDKGKTTSKKRSHKPMDDF